MEHYDYLIVGSGLFGATFAYRAHQAGKRCLVIDKRAQLGGNVYCRNIDGIHVHQYGAHIFHTNNKRVWDFVNSLVQFNSYTNSPIADYRGQIYNLPFNMNTFYQMWGVRTPDEAMAKIEQERIEAVKALRAKHGIVVSAGEEDDICSYQPQNLEEQALMLVGRDIYERLIKGYTEKQWGRPCTELPVFVIKRLPIRFIYDNNYFNDCYQGIPVGGYNGLIDKLLEGVETRVNCDFFDVKESLSYDKLVYTGQLDEYFGYRLGHLNYRTVRFETEVLNQCNYQGNAVVNYTDAAVPYTRIIEHKHFDNFGCAVYENPKTVISREYSTEWQPGMEPFYPINDKRNNELAEQYRALAAKEKNVIFGGRLGEYRYFDMAPIIEKVLDMEL